MVYNRVMGIITALTAQKKNKGRVNIFIDDEFVCGLELLTVMQHRLKVDDEISEAQLNQIIIDSENGVAFEKAVFYSNIRPRSEYEIRSYLKEKGYIAETIDTAVEKLFHYGYLDDTKFAIMYAECHRQKWGANRIKHELKNMRVGEECILVALEKLGSQYDEAFVVAERFIMQKRGFDYNKVYAHLYSRGFLSSTISDIMSELKQLEKDKLEE